MGGASTELPFLIVHGAIVWKILLAIFVAMGLPCVIVARRWLVRSGARSKARRWLRDVEPRAPGWKTIAGTLRGGAATSVRQAFSFANSIRDKGLWLEHPGGSRTDLVGDIEVEVGATERGMWWSSLDVAVPNTRSRWTSTLERSVRDGDEVVVRGLVKEAGGVWQIEAPIAAPLAICAARPKPAVYPLGLVRSGVLVAAFVFGGHASLKHIGSVAQKDAARTEPSDDRSTLTSISSDLALAAAMPGSRDDALELLRRELDFDFEHTEATLALTAAFDELDGTCPARGLEQSGHIEEALAAAKRCGNQQYARALEAILGRYDEAAADLDPADHGYLATTIAIARGDWKSAALGAAKRPCLAAMLRTYAGDPHAFDRVVDRKSCTLEEALTLAPEDRAKTLRAIERPDDAARDLVLEDVQFVFDPLSVEPSGLVTSALGDVHGALWLYRFAPPERFTNVAGDQALYGIAMLDMLRGDFAAARQQIERMGKPDGRPHTETEATFALREGSVTMPPEDRYREDWRKIRRGEQLGADVSFAVFPDECPLGAAYAAGEIGDGEPLVAAIRQCKPYWGEEVSNMLAVLPRVTSHRSELAQALRFYYNDWHNFDLTAIPFHTTIDAANHRDLARLAGDAEAAGKWQQVVARNDAMLSDERKAIAFLFWADAL